MRVRLGDTFVGLSGDHLCIVITPPAHPSAEVLVVNLTTRTPPCDESCIIREGEHPWIKHDTVVFYSYAFWKRNDELDAGLSSGLLEKWPPVSSELLQRIHQGALATHALKKRMKDSVRSILGH
jgi:hypothetical protein